MKVQLKHKVPKQHKVGRYYSMSLTKPEVIEFNKYHTLKKGKYTPEENNIIKKNWETFCQVIFRTINIKSFFLFYNFFFIFHNFQTHNWDPTFPFPFTQMEYENKKFYLPDTKNRMKFYQFLADGLPWRSVHSVFRHFKFIYDENARFAKL